VRALRVVVDPPFLDDLAGLLDAGEQVQVQASFAEAPVETLDIRIPGRLAGIDETKMHPVVVGPSTERPTAQFRTVVDDQDVGVSPLAGDALQHAHDPLARQ